MKYSYELWILSLVEIEEQITGGLKRLLNKVSSDKI